MSGTDHFSSASGKTVWLVYPNVFWTTTSHQLYTAFMLISRLTVPRIIPIKSLDIDQYPLELGNSERWVGVVQLDGDLVGEFLPRALTLLETSDNVVERGCTPEVLLLQAELLTAVEATQRQLNVFFFSNI